MTPRLADDPVRLKIYYIRRAYEFVCYIGIFLSQKLRKFIFHQIFFIDNSQTHFNFYYIYLNISILRTLFDEVVSVEKMNENFTTELNILRHQYEFIFKVKYLFVIAVDGFSK